MKLRFSALLLLFSFLLEAQPVLDRSNYFDIGDTALIYNKRDTSLNSFTVGASGASVLWDFSAMDFSMISSTDTMCYISPVGTPFYPSVLSADYSQSNLCAMKRTNPVDPSNHDYNYYIADTDSVSFIGHWADNGGSSLWEDHCNDLIKELSFPFTYLNSYTEPYERFFYDMSGSDEHYITGTNSVTADGYGTLITPDGLILTDVLRIHSVVTVRDSNALFGVINYTRHTYCWYSAGAPGFILAIGMDQNNSLIEWAQYQQQINYNTGIHSPQAGTNSWQVYPNPAAGQFTIRNVSAVETSRIEIFNALGEIVYAINEPGMEQIFEIDLSENGPGVYLVRICSGTLLETHRIVVQ